MINLANMTRIDQADDLVKVEAGVTNRKLLKHLTKHKLAIPIPYNPHQSIVASLVDDAPSTLMRTLGPISDFVSSLDVVNTDGQARTLSGEGAIADARTSDALVTEVSFKQVPSTDLWMIRRLFPYPGKEEFTAIIKALFLDSKVPQRSDLVLDAYTGKHKISVIRISGSGRGAQDKDVVTELIENAIAKGGPRIKDEILPESHHEEEVIHALDEGAYGVPNDTEIETHRVHRVVETDDQLSDYLELAAHDVHRGLALKDDRSGKLEEDLSLFLRYQLNRDDKLEINGFVYTRHHEPGGFLARLIHGGTPKFPANLPSLATAAEGAQSSRPPEGGRGCIVVD